MKDNEYIIASVSEEVPYGLCYRVPTEEIKKSAKYLEALEILDNRCNQHQQECIQSGVFVRFTEEDFKRSKLAESSTKGQ